MVLHSRAVWAIPSKREFTQWRNWGVSSSYLAGWITVFCYFFCHRQAGNLDYEEECFLLSLCRVKTKERCLKVSEFFLPISKFAYIKMYVEVTQQCFYPPFIFLAHPSLQIELQVSVDCTTTSGATDRRLSLYLVVTCGKQGEACSKLSGQHK